jgi:hypothetical protein
VQRAADHGEVVQVEAAGEEAGAHRQERAAGDPSRPIPRADEAGDRCELEQLVRIPRAGDVDDAARRIHGQAVRVGQRQPGDRGSAPPGVEGDEKMLVLPGDEQRDPALREDVPEVAARAVGEQPRVDGVRICPLCRDGDRISPRRVVPRGESTGRALTPPPRVAAGTRPGTS